MEQLKKSDRDYLNVKSNKDIMRIINNEELLYSDTIIKINKWNMSQERIIVITNLAIYNIKKTSKIINIT